ncbi:hypothetical protein ACP4OV_009512 [Aristida adscensionis]
MEAMQLLSRSSVLLLLRCPEVALVHRLSPPTRPLRPLSAPRRSTRCSDRCDVQSTCPACFQMLRSRLPHGSRQPPHCPFCQRCYDFTGRWLNQGVDCPSWRDVHPAHGEEDKKTERVNAISGDELSSDGKQSWAAEIPGHTTDYLVLDVVPNSSHRDGSIYKSQPDDWKEDYCIADRNETRFEAMMLSDPKDCSIIHGTCTRHTGVPMMQILSLKLAKIPMHYGSVKLYGYIAVRDNLDPLLNYIINISRDDPVTVEQGSIIKMAGPKRGIEFLDTILIEYDMKIKIGEQENDDLQLVDGVTFENIRGPDFSRPFINNIHGGCGTIEIRAAAILEAVEATVEVLISEVQSNFSMRLGCFISGLQEICLFDSCIGESHGLKKSVVAVRWNTWMDLKFKLGARSVVAEHCRSFKADVHGHAIQVIKTDFALISVKVTWSTLDGLYSYIT